MFMPRSFGWFLLTTVWSCFPPWKDLSRHYCDLVPLQSDRVEQVWRCISILSLSFLAVSFSKATALSHLFTLPPLLQLNLIVSLHQNSIGNRKSTSERKEFVFNPVITNTNWIIALLYSLISWFWERTHKCTQKYQTVYFVPSE